jgi:hypothetical protein
MSKPITMTKGLWKKLILDLRRRGQGRRESGAFLLSSPSDNRVGAYVCYDDLDSEALNQGIIIFKGAGYVRLWDMCLERQLRVIADVHTHPDEWTGQSDADQTHPMIGIPNHIALIVPHFARGNLDSLKGVGIYKYLGNHNWEESLPNVDFKLNAR